MTQAPVSTLSLFSTNSRTGTRLLKALNTVQLKYAEDLLHECMKNYARAIEILKDRDEFTLLAIGTHGAIRSLLICYPTSQYNGQSIAKTLCKHEDLLLKYCDPETVKEILRFRDPDINPMPPGQASASTCSFN